MQQELAILYQFLYHVTSVFIFQVKSWSDSTFCSFVHWELVLTLLKKQFSFLSGNYKKFSQLSADSADS